MPFLKIWIHFVWSTKYREPLLSQQVRPLVFAHIRENAATKKIHLDTINGYQDHVHCLISLGCRQTVSRVMLLLKGESSFWLNQQGLLPDPFEWQDEYFAASVSESMLGRVRAYIRNQEAHHRQKTFAEELGEIKKVYGFRKFL